MSSGANRIDDLKELTETFRRLGAKDPEEWAQSQLRERIPQLALFCFAKALWEGVLDEDDVSWIDEEVGWAKENRTQPCAQIGLALAEMLKRGVDRQTIVDLVRGVQYLALYHACSLMDGSRLADLPVKNWGLYQLNDQGQIVARLHSLHEILLSMDPTDREMRPRE